MKQAAGALLGAGLTAGACCAAGLILLDRLRVLPTLRQPERWPLAFTLGASLVHLAVFVALALQIAYWPVLVALLLVPVAEATRRGLWNGGVRFNVLPHRFRLLGGSLAAVFFGIYFIYAWAPEHSPDGSTYHLGLVARELRAHGFEKITTTFYAMLGQGVELVFLPAFAIGRHSAAALTHLAFAVALVWSMVTFGQRLGAPRVGIAAAVLTGLSPVFGLVASIAYIDAATATIAFAVFYWLHLWDQEREVSNHAWRFLIPVGLLAGYAFAAKFTAFTIGAYALLFILWRARHWKPLLTVTACAVLMAGPWIARNWIVYGNPAAPLLNATFRNPYVHVAFEQEYTAYMARYGVENRAELPLEVTVRGEKTQGLFGPIFLLLPVGLLALRRRVGRQLWLAGLLLSAPYLANVGTRFLIPALPFASFAITLALSESAWLLVILMATHAILSWPSVVPSYAAAHPWRMDTFPWRAALRWEDQDAFLKRRLAGYEAARLISSTVPRGEAVFTYGGVPDAYADREVLVRFQSARDERLADILQMGWNVGVQPIRVDVVSLAPLRTRHIRVAVTDTVPAGEQWSVHELRFFSGRQEVVREPQWKLQAFPFPWDIALAFDNSAATRWRSWETARRGMFVEVDFGREVTVDQIRAEVAAESPHIRLGVALPAADGTWKWAATSFRSEGAAMNPLARRMATYEMHRDGVRYMLLFDGDYGAEDMLEDPESWGLQKVGAVPGATLLKTIW